MSSTVNIIVFASIALHYATLTVTLDPHWRYVMPKVGIFLLTKKKKKFFKRIIFFDIYNNSIVV